ncbi:MAG: carbonate dehydratase [Mariprofundaceae bacterium]
MSGTEKLLENNHHWAARQQQADPGYFEHLSEQRSPEYMWIGCSDSRVPANEIIGLQPGEVFVHRNVGNIVAHNDLNCLSAVQFAVDVLSVKHIIVTGHYDCGAVNAALEKQHHGIVDNWIRCIRDIYIKHEDEMAACSEHEKMDRLCEFNVAHQVANLSHTRIVQNAWERGQELYVHGWIYRLKDGLLHDLEVTKSSPGDVAPIYRVTGLENGG